MTLIITGCGWFLFCCLGKGSAHNKMNKNIEIIIVFIIIDFNGEFIIVNFKGLLS